MGDGSGKRVSISAHRGGAERAPAGTMAAFLDAVAAGVDFVEFDVQRTRDGHLVVYHDRYAERRGVYPRQLRRSELAASISGDVLGLTDVLTTIAGPGSAGAGAGRARAVKAHIDVKGYTGADGSGYIDEVVTSATEALGAGNFVVTGADAMVRAVKQHFPDVRAALSLGQGWHEIPLASLVRTRWSELHPLARVRACGADAVAVHYRLARLGVLSACVRQGIGTMVWTVNQPAMIRSCIADHRIDVLITERPRYAMSVRPQ